MTELADHKQAAEQAREKVDLRNRKADIARQSGRLSEAKKIAQDALALARQNKDREAEAASLLKLSLIEM